MVAHSPGSASQVVAVLALAIASYFASHRPHPAHALSLSRLVGLEAAGTSPQVAESVAPDSVNSTALMQQALLYGEASVAVKAMANQSWPPSKLLHEGEDCWRPCGNVSGDCSWCGLGNACCRLGAKFDPPECEGATFSTAKWHTCVAPAQLHSVKHVSQECLSRCNFRSGYCDWCGAGNACCMEKAAALDAPECRGAYSYRSDGAYNCVPTLGTCGFGEVADGKGGCKTPGAAPTMSFYMYKASAPYWPLELNLSTDMGSLGGVLWYLHNDIVTDCPRKFGIDRILRYYVTMKPTDALYQKGQLFDRWAEFRQGKVADPSFQADHWDKYGYNVGCLRPDVTRSVARYQDAIWYSLPGRCPSNDFQRKTERCSLEQPGGYCAHPNGTSTCTWTATFAGEVFLDEIAGIIDQASFCNLGGFEYDSYEDKGVNNDFWNGKLNFEACSWRVSRVHQEFARKHPNLPVGLDRHPCDHDSLQEG
ncbi:unnamed protein product [Symbiodinium natans]|uniref:Uncharacterized protein n=1 Tax=Symbiodinium natans TaxID=878477 RepID=A0A812ICM9_9DINO|nr:unnamed protein product [Symbiodinium natans]